ncbi:armadillo repeat-containing protein 8-like [Hibiscus syriacus]|uniref:Armadillo repeat-containing protein 8-like n=1 Tax=Hibiscus syriacus TaxID=106335 RepID=A0A6A2WG42_HIBSY|nr:chaperonin-like RbcX protein 2, chloroplastic [Hibiscus syriacus]KAE8657822.1 armadillo repeat-containing protein 8-like [Hibiscus syriacus]
MVGALSFVGSSVMMDSQTGPYLCLDAWPSTNMNLNPGGELVLQRRNSMKITLTTVKPGSLELRSSFVNSWHDSRSSYKMIPCAVNMMSSRWQRKDRKLVVVDNLGGQYEDTFGDVKRQLLNYFTYKAVRTVLNQLYEMNPPQYTWFYQFAAANKPTDGKRFLRILGKERQELAERVMITRLHLYGKWIKICDHAQIYKEISDENLELMRERLTETVVWPSDDTNTEKIG